MGARWVIALWVLVGHPIVLNQIIPKDDAVARLEGEQGIGCAMASEYELEIFNDSEHLKYEAWLGKDAIADLTYQFAGDRIVIMRTVVNESFREHGVSTELIQYVLDDIRRSGRKTTVICPMVGEFIAAHPEYRDLVDSVHPGSGTTEVDEVSDFEDEATGDPEDDDLSDIDEALR
jgi:predicted GNAT family acetyltransferase